MIAVTILGNNSAIPAYDRHPTAQVVTVNDNMFLVDCGEGTQMQLSRYRIRRSRISHIFISHLHGDHYYGLAGLINSFGLWGREHDLHLYGPEMLKEIIDLQMKAGGVQLPFKLIFHVLGEDGVLVDLKRTEVSCFKVQHRVACWGFLFREKRNPRKLDMDNILAAGIPSSYYEKLQQGEDYTHKDGTIVKNESVTHAAPKGKSYAFCADTIYDESLAGKVKGVDMIYHETTYLHNLEERAASRFHSTTLQAGQIAKLAGAEKLLIGHFSSKYEKLDAFLEETASVFPNVELALEGVTYTA
jgi:ribonuclease Z